MVKELKTEEFTEKVIKNTKPVLIEVYGSNCIPCRMLLPTLEALSEKMLDIDFYKLNAEDEYEVAQKYNIMSVPTLLLFYNEMLLGRIDGGVTIDKITDMVEMYKRDWETEGE